MDKQRRKKTEEGGSLELGLERIDQDIDKLTKRAQLVIDDTEENFKDCPKCGLPTFMGPGSKVAFCARCGENYDVKRKVGEAKLKKRPLKKISAGTKIVVVVSAVGVMLLLLSLAVFYFVAEDTIDYIDVHDVNDIRGLPVERNVPQSMISPKEVEEKMRESIDVEARQRLWELQRFYQCLLIIPDSWDLVDIAENESSAAGIAGFYDTEEEKMYVVGTRHTTSYVNKVLAHELTHALQDQNFDLDAYIDLGDYDAELARLCAVEGDAMMTMDMWAEENLEDYEEFMIDLESLAQLVSALDFDGSYSSEILSEVAYYPYEGGYEFVQEVYDDGGWDAVNALFTTKPPLSTEQIMHPHKYINYEPPLDVSFDTPPANYSLRFTSVVGEKLFQEILYYYSGYFYFGGGLATGWGGDRFYYYQDGEDFLSVIATRWDSELDNQRFEEDMTLIYEDIAELSDDIYEIRGNYLHIESRGDSTTIYYGSSEDAVRQYMG
ncbi:MAG: hypothetical protein ACMUHM_06825 [Thermoplasmatota archaeon]